MQQDEIDKIIEEAVASSKKQSKWHRGQKKSNGILRARQILNAVFMLGFLAAVIIYFAYPENRILFFSVGFGAMALKIVEFILRFMF